jgi:hypothetical protein
MEKNSFILLNIITFIILTGCSSNNSSDNFSNNSDDEIVEFTEFDKIYLEYSIIYVDTFDKINLVGKTVDINNEYLVSDEFQMKYQKMKEIYDKMDKYLEEGSTERNKILNSKETPQEEKQKALKNVRLRDWVQHNFEKIDKLMNYAKRKINNEIFTDSETTDYSGLLIDIGSTALRSAQETVDWSKEYLKE